MIPNKCDAAYIWAMQSLIIYVSTCLLVNNQKLSAEDLRSVFKGLQDFHNIVSTVTNIFILLWNVQNVSLCPIYTNVYSFYQRIFQMKINLLLIPLLIWKRYTTSSYIEAIAIYFLYL